VLQSEAGHAAPEIAPPLLELVNVETVYGPIQALRGVSLRVRAGEMTAILGANGAGKTTLLRTILGLIDDQPEKGSIHFDGRRIDGTRTERIVRSGLAYVPEGRAIFPELTVRENLMVGTFARTRLTGWRDDLARIFDHFPVLAARAGQLAGTLSGGEQQMLAIGRALMNRPRMLLLDEPSLGLAPMLVTQIYGILDRIRETGLTLVTVEQNAGVALAHADTGHVLENGRLVASGTAAALLENEDVREFYLGLRAEASVRGTQRYKRRKRWS
jgi:branched-chain amino acid transport system ATP-binding protein